MKRGIYDGLDETEDWEYFGLDGTPDTLRSFQPKKDI